MRGLFFAEADDVDSLLEMLLRGVVQVFVPLLLELLGEGLHGLLSLLLAPFRWPGRSRFDPVLRAPLPSSRIEEKMPPSSPG